MPGCQGGQYAAPRAESRALEMWGAQGCGCGEGGPDCMGIAVVGGQGLVVGRAPSWALTVEGPEVVVPQVHQVLQGRVKLLHDALDPRTRAAQHRDRRSNGGQRLQLRETPGPGCPPRTWGNPEPWLLAAGSLRPSSGGLVQARAHLCPSATCTAVPESGHLRGHLSNSPAGHGML